MNGRMKALVVLITGLGVFVLALQLVPVDRSNPPVTSAMHLPEGEVGAALQAACYDCHSNETVWPWYSKVAPTSIVVAHHVEEGREHLNFSSWGDLDPERQDHTLEELVEMVEEGEMPLTSYTLAHPEARLTPDQRAALVQWAKAERSRLAVSGDDGR